MKDSTDNDKELLDFVLVKDLLVPAIIIYNNDPNDVDIKCMMIESFVRSLVILKSQAVALGITFVQVIDNCLKYFNETSKLTKAFINYFETKNLDDETIKKKTIKVLEIKVDDKCLHQIKYLLLLTNENTKNDCNN